MLDTIKSMDAHDTAVCTSERLLSDALWDSKKACLCNSNFGVSVEILHCMFRLVKEHGWRMLAFLCQSCKLMTAFSCPPVQKDFSNNLMHCAIWPQFCPMAAAS